MQIVEEMKKQVVIALKSKDEITKNILRFALSEIAALENQANQGGKPLTDGQIQKIIKKIIDGNTELLTHIKVDDIERLQKLGKENEILEEYLPKMLSIDVIDEKLTPYVAQILESKSVGQATGIAMKFFKEWGDSVDGNDVKSVVEKLRS